MFKLPGLAAWDFRIVLCGGQVVIEAHSCEGCLSMVIPPSASRSASGYFLVDHPQCALV